MKSGAQQTNAKGQTSMPGNAAQYITPERIAAPAAGSAPSGRLVSFSARASLTSRVLLLLRAKVDHPVDDGEARATRDAFHGFGVAMQRPTTPWAHDLARRIIRHRRHRPRSRHRRRRRPG